MSQYGKNYRNVRVVYDCEQFYLLVEVICFLKGFEILKFDESVEVYFYFGVDVCYVE